MICDQKSYENTSDEKNVTSYFEQIVYPFRLLMKYTSTHQIC